jgi:hypothetical protein
MLEDLFSLVIELITLKFNVLDILNLMPIQINNNLNDLSGVKINLFTH